MLQFSIIKTLTIQFYKKLSYANNIPIIDNLEVGNNDAVKQNK